MRSPVIGLLIVACLVYVNGSTSVKSGESSFEVNGIVCDYHLCYFIGIHPSNQSNQFTPISQPFPTPKFVWYDLSCVDVKKGIWYFSPSADIYAFEMSSGKILHKYSTNGQNIYNMQYDPTTDRVIVNMYNVIVSIDVKGGSNETLLTHDLPQEGTQMAPLDAQNGLWYLPRIDSLGVNVINLRTKTVESYQTPYMTYYLFLDEQGNLNSLTRNTSTNTIDVIRLNRKDPTQSPQFVMSIPKSGNYFTTTGGYSPSTNRYILFAQAGAKTDIDFYQVIDLTTKQVVYRAEFSLATRMISVNYN